MELSGHPNEILDIARNDPYCGVNPRSLQDALAGVERTRSVEIKFDADGWCMVIG